MEQDDVDMMTAATASVIVENAQVIVTGTLTGGLLLLLYTICNVDESSER